MHKGQLRLIQTSSAWAFRASKYLSLGPGQKVPWSFDETAFDFAVGQSRDAYLTTLTSL
jgi:hypothetical protein